MSKNTNHGDNISRLVQQLLDESVKLMIRSMPSIQKIAAEVVELVFIPKAMARQLVLAIALEAGVVTVHQVSTIFTKFFSNFSSRLRLIRQLEQQQQSVETQDEWMEIAEQIDNIQSKDVWRSEPTCPLYESDRIQSRIDEFVHLIRRHNVFDLIFTLRGGIARNRFGLLHEGLFSNALCGTKVLVETYHNVVCAALEFVCDAPTALGEQPIPTEARLAFFNETRHSYGRTALMLSGGAALGFYHVGVVKALMENGVLPRVISGASAGSIVSAMIATRTDEECKEMFLAEGCVAPGHSGILMFDFFRPLGTTDDDGDGRVGAGRIRKVGDLETIISDGSSSDSSESTNKDKHVDNDNNNNNNNPIKEVLENTAGAFSDGKRTWQVFAPIGVRKFTSFLYDILTGHRRAKDVLKSDTEHFRRCCRANIGNFTFQEAFDRTGRILNIIVSPQNRSDPPRLLNYLTAPHVLVWSAVVASSSLPGVFEPNKLLVKDANGVERYESASLASFIDGSMEADLPMQQLSEMFNVNHFIISQANVHAVMFSSMGMENSVWSRSLIHGVLVFLKRQVREWIGHVIELIGGQRAAPLWDTKRGLFSQFFTQEYEGRDIDISIIPWCNHRSIFSALLHCIYNPSHVEFQEWIHAAERETWGFIPKIKSHVAEEMMLDQCVQRLRRQILAERTTTRFGLTAVDNVNAEEEQKIMLKCVPSFFTSASIVNMSGLGITDQHSNHNPPFHDSSNGDSCEAIIGGEPNIATTYDVPDEIPGGWKGMGLRGNFSSGNMNHLSSARSGSGLFLIDGDSEDENSTFLSQQKQQQQQQQQQQETCKSTQEPGEVSHVQQSPIVNISNGIEGGQGYLKTTSMANFYYRKSSHGSLSAGSLVT